MDLGSTCYKYIWCGPIVQGGRRIFEKVDRGLSNNIWRTMFPEAHVQVLHRLDYFDHHLILIRLMDNEFRRKNRDFRFESAWLVENSLETLLKGLRNNNVNLSGNLEKFREQATQ